MVDERPDHQAGGAAEDSGDDHPLDPHHVRAAGVDDGAEQAADRQHQPDVAAAGHDTDRQRHTNGKRGADHRSPRDRRGLGPHGLGQPLRHRLGQPAWDDRLAYPRSTVVQARHGVLSTRPS
ncbi:MAG TPA: hypothetical protein VN969_26810 [Streptosporangiaceae bacterium]|nr:hypothetical protein [Streptosporangiaceae bacterium]